MKKTNQQEITTYYNRFSKLYDWISSDAYYRKPRMFAINSLGLVPNDIVMNLPCGTGQNFEYFQQYLNNTGAIIGVDISHGMLAVANQKISKNGWTNIKIIPGDATKINTDWVNTHVEKGLKFDAILCDLGLSGFPEWQSIINNLLSLLKPGGKLVIMDWFIERPNLRGKFISWIGKGEVNRPLYQYLKPKVLDFKLNKSFKKGNMFVAVGIMP